MTREQIEAIRARLAKASPAPWWVDVETTVSTEVADASGTVARIYRGEATVPGPRPDAAFIAHAPADVSALLEEVERLTRENERLAALAR
jgi:hypothetical protein